MGVFIGQRSPGKAGSRRSERKAGPRPGGETQGPQSCFVAWDGWTLRPECFNCDKREQNVYDAVAHTQTHTQLGLDDIDGLNKLHLSMAPPVMWTLRGWGLGGVNMQGQCVSSGLGLDKALTGSNLPVCFQNKFWDSLQWNLTLWGLPWTYIYFNSQYNQGCFHNEAQNYQDFLKASLWKYDTAKQVASWLKLPCMKFHTTLTWAT